MTSPSSMQVGEPSLTRHKVGDISSISWNLLESQHPFMQVGQALWSDIVQTPIGVVAMIHTALVQTGT